jgi:hypothetical protein
MNPAKPNKSKFIVIATSLLGDPNLVLACHYNHLRHWFIGARPQA